MTGAAWPRRARTASSPRPSALLVAVWAAVSSALAGLAVTSALLLVAWGSDSRSTASAGAVLRLAVQTWLLSHHGTLRLASGHVGLLPLGLVALPAVLLLRSGTSLGRVVRVTDLAGTGRAVAMLAGAYALLVTGVTGLVGGGQVSVAPLGTLFGAVTIATLAGGAGVLRGAGLGWAAFRALPAHARLVLRAAGTAVGTLLAVGAVLAGVALIADLGRAGHLAHALAPALFGGLELLLLGLLYTPNAAVWAAAYATGPGFAFGMGTSVSAFGVRLGPVPAFPLLAGLPEGDDASRLTWPFLGAPLVAGVVAGVFVARRLDTGDYGPPHRPGAAGLWAAASGVVGGLLFAAIAAVSGGPLGPGRLSAVGPSPWQVGLASAVEFAVAGGITAAALSRYAARGPTTSSKATKRTRPRSPTEPAKTAKPTKPTKATKATRRTRAAGHTGPAR